ncbi:hypothetical protein J7T55_006348 [Diaporthe amygdali]|uniref:uncharacterized protein n=1 Tax=Phomopsis amygdali TaxID=1214568 RepID=UPI0022FEBB4F|nr:uncharacterized protein J7T55_006348 [Diaporthe amygdali]KAJ0125005.1 hypothetical protein J7T55_006348 [Diaporthe amygdali]
MNRLALRVRGARLPLVSASTTTTRVILPISARRHYASSAPKDAEQASAQSGGSRSKDAKEQAEQVDEVDTGNNPSNDRLAGDGAKGRTGGGEPLSSSENAPPRPKINSASIPGQGTDKLTKEQQEEVDRHNAEFEKKHDRASPAAEDKVDKNFWKGAGGVEGH